MNEMLLKVQKPARYIGGEWNSVRKEWTADRVKVLLAFPEVYEVGMSYLGLKILYGILNCREDCLAERVFSPWPDFEHILRGNNIELFSLESRRPIKDFDIIGFSLAYELNYTNVLNLLDLGGIPLRSSERGEGHPIVIAGGPACFNPEPMAEFIDAFVIGDGEEAIGQMVDIYKGASGPLSLKLQRAGKGQRPEAREILLRELAGINGVYVPSLYEVEYNSDGTIKNFYPKTKYAPENIAKAVVSDLDSSFYPVDQIVPYIQIVHDRIMLEIMRGCKHSCKFCQAGTTYRPCRERSKEKVIDLAKRTYMNTGYDEISLLSLSSGDHSQIKDIIEDLNDTFEDNAIAISIPSLRIEETLNRIPELISKVKKTGLTFAVEAGSECLRRSINKNINMERLFDAVSESFKSGWRKVKLYFMIGLPDEKEEDLSAIIDLLYRVSNARRQIDKKDAHVTASINAFVPRPHTPFQRHAMERADSLNVKKNMLRDGVRSRMIELDFHSFQMGYLEGVFARGDRRLSKAVYSAWKSGLKFDGWNEFFNFDLWLKAFEDNSIDPDFYAARTRGRDEILPWGFIDIRA